MIYIVATCILTLLTRRFAARLYRGGPNIPVGAQRLLGRVGIVLDTINPDVSKGLVRVDHEDWIAQSEDGAVIETGAKVEVLRIEGTRLIVRREEQKTEGDA